MFFCYMGVEVWWYIHIVGGREVWRDFAFAQGIPILLLSNLKNHHEHADSLCWHLPTSLDARFLTQVRSCQAGKDAIATLQLLSSVSLAVVA